MPDGFGTGDCLIVADRLLHIIDLKYGQGVLVDAVENPQMMLYALGALRIFDCLYNITEVSMTIYQPRRENVSTWTVSVEELDEWAEQTLKPKAELAFKGEGEYSPGAWCQFCKAAVKCRARAEAKLQLAKYEFAKPPLLTDAEIGDILGKLDDLTKWANEIIAYAQEAAVSHGKQWPGYKLVESRTNRKYTDEDAVVAAARAAGYTDIFKKSLIPITEMEKLMGKKTFAEVLGSLVIKPKGKPTLVPASDKRPAITTTDANLDLRVRREHVPYDVWERQGYLQTTEGNVVHYGYIEKFIESLGERFNIREIAFDRWGAVQMVQNLEGMGFTVVPFGQGFKDMSPPTKELMKLVLEQRIAHGGHPVLRWMMDNIFIRTDPAGNIKPDKEKSTEKIDGAVATIMALDRAIRCGNDNGESVYDQRGLLFI